MDDLTERVALTTGAAQGIGAAIAYEFARAGALVVGIDRQAEKLEFVCHAVGGQAFAFDIGDHGAYERCVREVDERYGRIDVLVNNGAIRPYADILELTLEQWRQIQTVTLEAVYWGARLVAPVMARGGWGRIISIFSLQALATDGKVGAYAAAKGGINSFTRSLAVKLAPCGILANAMLPGCIHTPMSVVNGVDETTTEYFQKWYVEQRKIPLARAGEPEEIARVAVFLAGSGASYITGQTLVVDGGLSITF